MANDINHVLVVGRLTRDMELSYTQGGLAVGKFSVAVNRGVKKGDAYESVADFFDVTYFGKGAEAVKPYLLKGKQIAVDGALRQDRWEKDGQKFSKVHIIANAVQLLGGKSEGGEADRAAANEYGDYSLKSGGVPSGDSADFPEDIPF